MKLFAYFSIIYLSITSIVAQQHGVHIIEKKNSKRHLIYAENTTDENRSVFLKVNAIGYRRTADRPTIKIIPPKSTVLLHTLIPLKNVVTDYTYIFTVNIQEKNIDVTRVK